MIEDNENDIDWDGHQEVVKLISTNTELQDISKRLNNNDKKKIFEDILWGVSYYRTELKNQLLQRTVDGDLDKNNFYQYCKEYIDSEFVHNSFLTNLILEQMIDVELLQLNNMVRGASHPGYSNLESINLKNDFVIRLNKWVSFSLSLLFFVIGISVGYFLFSYGLQWAAYGITFLLTWHYFGELTIYYNTLTLKNKYSDTAIKLRRIRNEVSSHSFDSRTISERIKNVENDGLYISSLIYPLLHIGD